MMDFKKLTLPYKNEMLENLHGFCAINSELDDKTADANNPFGVGVTKALKFFEALARKDGFEVNNYSNMAIEVLIGSGDKNVTIMAHADVVPAGEGWDQDPYKLETKNGELIGRGVADDKGPLLSCYYALKALRDNNLLGNYQVRFLVGGNEECGSRGMIHYFHELKHNPPTYGFSPDASFPVVYAEKGMLGFRLKKKVHISGLRNISGGVATNAVISRCKVLWDKDDNFLSFVKEHVKDVEIKENSDSYEFTFIGESAHGSVPWMGVNAALIALKIIYEYSKDHDLLSLINKVIDPRGKGVDAYFVSPDMDNCTTSLNVGLIDFENNKIVLSVDFRFGNSTNYEQLVSIIQKVCDKDNVEAEFGRGAPLLYFPKDSPLISTLYKVYQEESGDYASKPISMGGGTYAKVTVNTVAYGLEFPGVDALMHAPGEHIKIDTLVLGMQIYARAIYELGKLIENEN